MRTPLRSRRCREGSALVEFSLSTLFWIPLLLGTIFIGLNIVRAIEVTQICRDAGHMEAYGVDFSQPANQQILVQLAAGFTFTVNSGNGVIILSTITMISPQDCTAAGLSSCANINYPVFTRRIVIGNSSLRSSSFGTPNAADIDASGNISAKYYLNDTTTRAGTFNSVLPLLSGQYAYLAEAYFSSPDLNWPGFVSGSGNYTRVIF